MKYKILLRVKGNVVVKLLLRVYKNTKHLHLPSASLYISAKKKKKSILEFKRIVRDLQRYVKHGIFSGSCVSIPNLC